MLFDFLKRGFRRLPINIRCYNVLSKMLTLCSVTHNFIFLLISKVSNVISMGYCFIQPFP